MYDIPLNETEADYPPIGNVDECETIVDPDHEYEVSEAEPSIME
jgi:hypothetical protein